MQIDVWKEAGGPWRLTIDGREAASSRVWSEAVEKFGRILVGKGCNNIVPLFEENWSYSRRWFS